MTTLFLLVALVLATWLAFITLRRTRDLPEPLSANDRRFRSLALALLVVLVAGFGLCGGVGVVFGVGMVMSAPRDPHSQAISGLVFLPGLAGLAIAAAIGRALWRGRRIKSDKLRDQS